MRHSANTSFTALNRSRVFDVPLNTRSTSIAVFFRSTDASLPRSNPARVAIRLARASRRAVRDDVDVDGRRARVRRARRDARHRVAVCRARTTIGR
jgi:hypothetical protein